MPNRRDEQSYAWRGEAGTPLAGGHTEPPRHLGVLSAEPRSLTLKHAGEVEDCALIPAEESTNVRIGDTAKLYCDRRYDLGRGRRMVCIAKQETVGTYWVPEEHNGDVIMSS